MKRFVLICLAATLGFAGEAQAACDGIRTANARQIPVSIGMGEKPPNQVCSWQTPRIKTGECTVTKVRVEGAGPRPAAIDVTRKADGAKTAGRSTNGSNGNWFWAGNNLNCSSAGCGTSAYKVETSKKAPSFVCQQILKVIIELG